MYVSLPTVRKRQYVAAYPRTGDQVQPICLQCQKKNRPCLRGDASNHIRIKHYQIRKDKDDPQDAPGPNHDERSHLPEHRTPEAVVADVNPQHINNQSYAQFGNKEYHNASLTQQDDPRQGSTILRKPANDSLPAPLTSSPVNNNTATSPYFSAVSIPISQLIQPESLGSLSPASSAAVVHEGHPLTYKEAYLVRHFATHLGKWLDCTDASRQFTRKIPILVKQSPILLHAVLSYAARHIGDAEMAERAHECCVELLIPSLSSESVVDDDTLLCAIVILRVFEQLNGKYESFEPMPWC